MQELGLYLVSTLPWQLRALIGHFLPLALSLYFLWQMRGLIKQRIALPWLFGVAATGQLLWMTAKLETYVINGKTAQGITLLISAAIWVAVLAQGVAIVSGKRVHYRALFAGTFLPLWVVDVLCCLKVFPGQYDMLYRAIGGAGPLDALLLGPVLAVVCARVFEFECKNYERWNGWMKRQLLKLKPSK